MSLFCSVASWYAFGSRSYSSFKLLKEASAQSPGGDLDVEGLDPATRERIREALRFWVVYSVLMVFEAYVEILVCWVPLYYYVKLVALVWMANPDSRFNTVAFERVVSPYVHPKIHWMEEKLAPATTAASQWSGVAVAHVLLWEHALEFVPDAELLELDARVRSERQRRLTLARLHPRSPSGTSGGSLVASLASGSARALPQAEAAARSLWGSLVASLTPGQSQPRAAPALGLAAPPAAQQGSQGAGAEAADSSDEASSKKDADARSQSLESLRDFVVVSPTPSAGGMAASASSASVAAGASVCLPPPAAEATPSKARGSAGAKPSPAHVQPQQEFTSPAYYPTRGAHAPAVAPPHPASPGASPASGHDENRSPAEAVPAAALKPATPSSPRSPDTSLREPRLAAASAGSARSLGRHASAPTPASASRPAPAHSASAAIAESAEGEEPTSYPPPTSPPPPLRFMGDEDEEVGDGGAGAGAGSGASPARGVTSDQSDEILDMLDSPGRHSSRANSRDEGSASYFPAMAMAPLYTSTAAFTSAATRRLSWMSPRWPFYANDAAIPPPSTSPPPLEPVAAGLAGGSGLEPSDAAELDALPASSSPSGNAAANAFAALARAWGADAPEVAQQLARASAGAGARREDDGDGDGDGGFDVGGREAPEGVVYARLDEAELDDHLASDPAPRSQVGLARRRATAPLARRASAEEAAGAGRAADAMFAHVDVGAGVGVDGSEREDGAESERVGVGGPVTRARARRLKGERKPTA